MANGTLHTIETNLVLIRCWIDFFERFIAIINWYERFAFFILQLFHLFGHIIYFFFLIYLTQSRMSTNPEDWCFWCMLARLTMSCQWEIFIYFCCYIWQLRMIDMCAVHTNIRCNKESERYISIIFFVETNFIRRAEFMILRQFTIIQIKQNK